MLRIAHDIERTSIGQLDVLRAQLQESQAALATARGDTIDQESKIADSLDQLCADLNNIRWGIRNRVEGIIRAAKEKKEADTK